MCICRKIFDAHLSVLIAVFAFVISFLHETEKKKEIFGGDSIVSFFINYVFSFEEGHIQDRSKFARGQTNGRSRDSLSEYFSFSVTLFRHTLVSPFRKFPNFWAFVSTFNGENVFFG